MIAELQEITQLERVQVMVRLYREKGLVPFPVCYPHSQSTCRQHGQCRHPGKVPLLAKWTEIKSLPSHCEGVDEIIAKHDGFVNLGLRTGLEQGLIVVDVDGDEGQKSLEDWPLLPTGGPLVRTGRIGGYHYWFRPKGQLQKKINFLPKVDLIAEGGFVLAPPSKHASGNVYSHVGDGIMADSWPELPHWVETVQPRLTIVTSDLPPANDSEVGIGRRALEFLEHGATAGQREEAVNAVVNLLGRGMDRDEIVERVTRALCDRSPQLDAAWPWSRADVEKMVQSFERRGGPKEAKALPEAPTLVLDQDGLPDLRGNRVPAQPSSEPELRDIFDALGENDEIEEPLVEGLLWPARCHTLYADSGTGKTLFSLELLLHLAAGRDYHGRRVQRSKVLLIEIDDTYQLQDYITTMRDAYGFTREELAGWFMTNLKDDTDFNLRDEQGRIRIQRMISKFEPQVVVLDALEMFLSGGDAYGAKNYEHLRALKDWCKEKGIALLVIDHALKGWSKPDRDGNLASHDKALAGGGQKMAVYDVALHMVGDLAEGPVSIYYAKIRGQKPDPILWRFTEEGSKMKAKLIGDPYKGLTPREVSIIKWIGKHGPASTQQVIEGAKVSRSLFWRVMQAKALPRGLVERVEEGRRGAGAQSLWQSSGKAWEQAPVLVLDDNDNRETLVF